jgi:hypothetical protein
MVDQLRRRLLHALQPVESPEIIRDELFLGKSLSTSLCLFTKRRSGLLWKMVEEMVRD